MEDLDIILPCGFIAKYKDIFCSKNNFECPECKTHTTSQEECLHLPRNKLIINQAILNSKKNKFKDCLKKLELYKNDPKFYIDESYTKIKNNIYLRREEIKIMLNKKIDEYFENLLKMVDDERDSNFVVVFDKLKQISSLEQETSNLNVKEDSDVFSKIKLIKEFKSKIDSGTHFVENTIEKFTEANLKLMESNEHVDITKLFGELFLGPETNIISYGSEQDIDDDSRSEATFQFVINDFSKCIKSKNLKLTSKPCIVRNLEWTFAVEFNERENDESALHCILVYNPTSKSHKWGVDARLEVKLLNTTDNLQSVVRIIEHWFFDTNIKYCSFDDLVCINKVMNPKNKLYNHEKDSITIEVNIKAQLPKLIEK